MKFPQILFLATMTVFAGDQKQLPGQAGNDDVDLQAFVYTTPVEMKGALDGASMQAGYLIVRIKVTPKTQGALRVGPDDFTMLSRKDGQRSPAQAPNQVVGSGAVLVVRPANEQPHGDGTTVNGPVWGGVSVKKRSDPTGDGTPQVKNSGEGANPLMQTLAEKGLADKEYKEPVEGLLYFGFEGKLKPKDLSLMYTGQAGKLIIDFK